MDNQNRLVSKYFHCGLTTPEIVVVLAIKHRIILSERTIKRRLRSLGLYRRKHKSNLEDVALYILENIETSGKLHGYRWMYWKCLKGGFTVSQEDVRCLLSLIDPKGVDTRKRKRLQRRQYYNKGSNFVWHLDGYDKLKPYGIAIHGCIDGFSRHIIWLRAGHTNNNPRVIANYYINTVERTGGTPVKIRADRGTENRHVEQMQVFLRRNHEDDNFGGNSFVYGSSTHNQRIEWFWGLLRKENAQYWMNIFQMLKQELNGFSGDFLDKSILQFCFLRMIQRELDEVVAVWNTHRLQKKKNSNAATGKPLLLYNVPQFYGGEEMLCHVDPVDIDVCKEELTELPILSCDETVRDLCCIVMQEREWNMPLYPDDGIELYMNLRTTLRNML